MPMDEPPEGNRAPESDVPSPEASPRPEAEEAKPARRRRTTSPRTSRARAPKSVPDAPAEPVPAPEEVQPAPEPVPEPAQAAPEDTGAPEPGQAPEDAPQKSARSRRSRGARRPAAEKPQPSEEASAVTPEAVGPVEPAEPEPEAVEQPARRPARRRGERRGGRKSAAAPEGGSEPPAEPQPEPDTEQAAKPEEAPSDTAPPAKAPRARERTARRRSTPDAGAGAVAKLVVRRGQVELQVDGQMHPPIFFFGNLHSAPTPARVMAQVKQAAQAGVHIHSTLVELPCPLPPDGGTYEDIDERVQMLLDADPQGWVIPRLVFVPAAGWAQQYPDEIARYADGSTGDPSIASERFWTEAEHALAAAIEHVNRTPYGSRVIGYHLEYAEWFHPRESGYDRSFANREAFRTWLRAKYRNSEAALRAAWFDGQVQFYTADTPKAPESPVPATMFWDPKRQRCFVDFLEFTSDTIADRLIGLARTVKNASGGHALVSVCYGYTTEFTHAFSGHFALARLLASPAIDIVAGPPSYADRLPGGAGSYPSAADSPGLHGKLWVTEDDTRTYLAPPAPPEDFNPRVDSKAGTDSVQLRTLGRALAHQTGIAWMDVWGEGWLDSPEMWARIGKFGDMYRAHIRARKAWSPDVVALVSERSLLHVQRGEEWMARLLHEQRDLINRAGVSVQVALQRDVTARNFPLNAKLYLFLDPYRISTDHRAAIRERLQGGGRTLVWMYAVGVCDERGRPDEMAHDVVGMWLRRQSWGSEVGTRIVSASHPITEHLQSRVLGSRERLTPSYFVDETGPGITVLGEYHQSGLPSIAVRELADWRSVFCGEPMLTQDLFKGLCRYAGVHTYVQGGDDFTDVGDGWITVHAARDGHRTISLPRPAALYDVTESRLLAANATEHRMSVRARTTHVLYWGTLDEMKRLGFSGLEQARGRRRGAAAATPAPTDAAPPSSEPSEPPAPWLEGHAPVELPAGAPATPAEVEPETAAPLDLILDLDGLPEVPLEMASPEVVTAEPEAGAPADEAALGDKKKRRRRRGGRGRGGRGRDRTPPAEA